MGIHIIKIEDKEFIFDTNTDRGRWLFNDLMDNNCSKFKVFNGAVWYSLKYERGIAVTVQSVQKDWLRDDYIFECKLTYPLADDDLLARYYRYYNL